MTTMMQKMLFTFTLVFIFSSSILLLIFHIRSNICAFLRSTPTLGALRACRLPGIHAKAQMTHASHTVDGPTETPRPRPAHICHLDCVQRVSSTLPFPRLGPTGTPDCDQRSAPQTPLSRAQHASATLACPPLDPADTPRPRRARI